MRDFPLVSRLSFFFRGEVRDNFGTFHGDRGDAEKEIKAAIQVQPFCPAYVNLAALYRANRRDLDGERILHEGRKLEPNIPTTAILSWAVASFRQARRENAAANHCAEAASAFDDGG